jgi:hypothetical protein
MRPMRQVAYAAFAGAMIVAMAAGPANAKGMTDHAKVTISGAGLPSPGVTLGSDGAAFALGSGPWAQKWDAPNIGGSLEPNAHLGRALVVHVVLTCEDHTHSSYEQTLYPDAPEGPQLYTRPGTTACGDVAPAGYDALGPATADLLRTHGVELHPPEFAPEATTRASSGRSGAMLATVGVPFVLALIVGEEVVRRRRRRTE